MTKRQILLVNPHIEDFSAYDHFSKPLGILKLAAYLKDDFELHFVNALTRVHPGLPAPILETGGTGEFYKERIDKPTLLQDIPRYFKRYGLPDQLFTVELSKNPPPDYILLTTGMTYWVSGAQHTISLLRKTFPKAKIIAGGIYCALLPEHARAHLDVDAVVGLQNLDAVLIELSHLLGVDLPGGYRPPAYELSPETYYLPVMTSTGCVFHCSYCASPALDNYAAFPPEAVADMIIREHRERGVSNFAFYDDALLFQSEEHFNRIQKRVIASGIQVNFYTPNGLHIRFLTKQTAGLMKQAGFCDIRLSLESGNADFQKERGNKATNPEFEAALEMLKSAGFERKEIRVYTLLNVPGEDAGAIEGTMRYIDRCGALPMLAMYSPIPGTPDFARAMQITDVSEPLFQNNTVYLYRSGFDLKYLLYLKRLEKAYRDRN